MTGTIPSELGEIRTLEQIDLNFNLLEGSIPEELYNLSNLRQMDLNDNELTGTISTEIGKLTRLSFFQIENNRFSGTVPSQISALNILGEYSTCHDLVVLRCIWYVVHHQSKRFLYFLLRYDFDSSLLLSVLTHGRGLHNRQ